VIRFAVGVCVLVPVLVVAHFDALPNVRHGHASGFCHAPLHRQQLVVVLKGKSFLVEPGGGVVDVTGAGGQVHRQPMRRAHVGVHGLRQLARHTGLGHVRVEAGAEGDDDADEDECAEARRVLLRLRVEKRNSKGCVAGRGCVWALRALGVPPERTANPRAAGTQLGRGHRRQGATGSPAVQSEPSKQRAPYSIPPSLMRPDLHRFRRLGGSGILGHLLGRRRLVHLGLLLGQLIEHLGQRCGQAIG
jgi:hypothetical protein